MHAVEEAVARQEAGRRDGPLALLPFGDAAQVRRAHVYGDHRRLTSRSRSRSRSRRRSRRRYEWGARWRTPEPIEVVESAAEELGLWSQKGRRDAPEVADKAATVALHPAPCTQPRLPAGRGIPPRALPRPRRGSKPRPVMVSERREPRRGASPRESWVGSPRVLWGWSRCARHA